MEARANVYDYKITPLYSISRFSFQLPPLRKGFTTDDDPHSRGFYTRTGLSPPIRGFVKSARLWLYNSFDQCMKHYAVGVSFPHEFFFFTLTYSPHLSLTAHPILRLFGGGGGGCVIACVHTEFCIWPFESKLTAFYNGDMSFGCRFAQLHFWFFTFVFSCNFMILFWVIFVLLLGFMHLRILQLPEMRFRSVV